VLGLPNAPIRWPSAVRAASRSAFGPQVAMYAKTTNPAVGRWTDAGAFESLVEAGQLLLEFDNQIRT